ncbi:MAG: hypothetical protein JWP88_1431 [Flaviaesturariibacter sp.]|nr:hypothetical protein [Flaviaesturariibacter sp.]
MKQLQPLLVRLEAAIPQQALIVPEVSNGSIGWHIEHSLLVMDAVADALQASDPAGYKKRFDIKRNLVMALGIIPRGRVKAPKGVQPVVQFDAASLEQHLAQTLAKLEALSQLSPGHYFTHPFMGDFKLAPALRFLAVHTRHHVKIIGDVMKKANG